MVRVIIKGGVWKNTEDEILKAAISKYGKNQWARISSLLVRKTPKQCKARWYEWLDPSIKKTEWSKEEDEKLLHLAKLMPTQWRTIAPLVGRTATQCLERYQKLLDEAEQRDNDDQAAGPSGSGLGLAGPGGGESAPSAEDVRRLRPGEVDPDPETKPARPDPIDMDEDEKEMLSEARARLANTQGKKAKRKARERALEEARRLAMLQKRRELKAAGITQRVKPPKKGMDFMTDIPFEKQPARGYYDVSEEESRAVRAPVGRTIAQMNNQNTISREDDERKRKQKEAERKKQSEQGKEVFSRQKEEQLRKLREAEQISKRRRLNLPEAQVGQRELDEIVKLGMASETARSLVADGSETTEGLLSEYSALDRAKEAQTPRTAPEEDAVMREARNLRNMANQQTPLLGDANAEIHEGTGHTGALPSKTVKQTPNPLLTPARTGRAVDGPGSTPVSETPRTAASATPMRTPLRDNLGLNTEDGFSAMGGTPRDMKRAAQAAKMRLQNALQGLPAPKNDFELVLDGEESEQAQDGVDEVQVLEEDATEREMRLAKIAADEREKEFARRSQAVQRGLPRPANVDLEGVLEHLGGVSAKGDLATRALLAICEEMVYLVKHDSIVYPIAGSRSVGGQQSALPTIPDEQLAEAKTLIHQDMANTFGFPGANETVLRRMIATLFDVDTEEGQARVEEFEKALQQKRDSLKWDAKTETWQDGSDMSAKSIVAGQAARLEALREEMGRQALQAAKEEMRLGKLLGGYQARSKALGESVTQGYRTLEERAVEQAAFARLQANEETAIQERQRALETEVATLERRERMAQDTYRERDEARRALRAEVEALEDELAMREAEKLNETALQEEAGGDQ